MNLKCIKISATATRYLVSAQLGANSRLLLVTTDNKIVAGWRTFADADEINGEWVSPYPDLTAVVDGVEVGAEPSPESGSDHHGVVLTIVQDPSPSVLAPVAHTA